MKSQPRNRSGYNRYLSSTLFFSTDTSPGSWYNYVVLTPWNQYGWHNLDWQAQIEAGNNAASAYSTSGGKMKVFSRRDARGTYNETVGGKTVVRNAWHYSNGAPSWSTPYYTSVQARNRAVSRFYAKLRDVYQAFDGLTFLGELLETRRMILRRASDLTKLMLNDHKRNMRSARRVRGSERRKKVYSQGYLEATFGWMPFFSDLSKMYEAFDHEVQPIVRIRSSAYEEDSPVLEKLLSGTGIFAWDVYTRKAQDVRYSFVAGVRPNWNRPDAFGFDLRNVPLAAWELTPWSFAVDYFVDIQGWLTSKVYSMIQPIYSVESVLQTYKVRTQEVWNHNRFSSSRNFQAGPLLDTLSTSYQFNRTHLVGLPQMKGPTLRGLPSAKQLLNLVALYSARSDYSNL